MKVSSFHAGTHLTLNSKTFKIIRKVQNKIFLENTDDLSVIAQPVEELLQRHAKGELSLIGVNARRPHGARFSKDLQSLDPEHREIVYYRLSFISKAINVLGKQPTTVGLQSVISGVGQALDLKTLPTIDSVYRWWKRYHRSGGDIMSLQKRKPGKGGIRRFSSIITDEIQTIIEEEYFSNNRPPPSHVYRLLEHKVELLNRLRPSPLKFPSRAQFYRIIKGLDQYQTMLHRQGIKAADKHFRLTGAGPSVRMILERVEVDHSPIDALLVDDVTGVVLGRPTLTLLIDVYSRMILGIYIGFEPPSLVAVMRALRHAILPKDNAASYLQDVTGEWPAFGIPMNLICDNGSEFHAETLKRLCAELDINLQFCPKAEAGYKGTVERLVGTINREVCHRLPGTTFGSIEERGDYKSDEYACVTEKELKNFICRWIVDIYHNRVHTKTKRTPLAMWNEGLQSVSPILPESETALAFCMTHEEKRHLTHKGIEIFSMFYNSADLRALRCRKQDNYDVIVRADPEDLGRIWVFDDKNGDYICVPSITPEYATGLSLRQHKHIRKHLIDKGLGEQNKKAVLEHIYRLNEDIKSLKSNRLQRKRRKAAQLTQTNQNSPRQEDQQSAPLEDIVFDSFESFDVFQFASATLEDA
ncbi:Mu transposase C-terminal domain-containing protein [Alteromonas sp. A081]|uniref:Mu transposase C-terminal domain-containing protein n=1 Tax=Alteromonas sp. A081 TaxID=3410269 RepID=UPI003B983794